MSALRVPWDIANALDEARCLSDEELFEVVRPVNGSDADARKVVDALRGRCSAVRFDRRCGFVT